MAARKRKKAAPKPPALFSYIPQDVVKGLVTDKLKATIEGEMQYMIEDIVMDGLYDQLDKITVELCKTKAFRDKVKKAVTVAALANIKSSKVYVDIST